MDKQVGIRHLMLVMVLLWPAVPLFPNSNGVSQELAAIYTSQAYDLMADGYRLDARQLAERALRYYSSYSDAHVIIAFSYQPNSQDRERIIDHLQRAIDGSGLERYSRIDVRVFLADLYIQTHRLQAAEAVLPHFDDAGIPRQGLVEVWVDLLYARSEYREADYWLEQGLRLYPDSARLITILLQRDKQPDFFTRAFLEHALQASPYYREALLRFVETQKDMDVRQTLLQRYYALGGESPRAAWLQLRDAVAGDDAAEIQKQLTAFTDAGGMERWDLLYELYQLALPDEILGQLDDRLNRKTGTVRWYEPYAQLPTQWIQLRDGELIRWHWDENTNGFADREVGFVAGMPYEAVMHHDATSYRYQYHYYPWVTTITEEGEQSSVQYSLVPFTLELSIFSELPVREARSWAAVSMREPRFHNVFNPAVATGRIRRMQTELSDGSLRTRIYVMGQLGEEHLADPDGQVFKITEFENGAPVRSSRSLQHDGYFDLSRAYRDGVPVASAYDLTRDGSADVWEYRDERAAQIWKLHNEPLIGLVISPWFANEPFIDIFYFDDEKLPMLEYFTDP